MKTFDQYISEIPPESNLPQIQENLAAAAAARLALGVILDKAKKGAKKTLKDILFDKKNVSSSSSSTKSVDNTKKFSLPGAGLGQATKALTGKT